MQTITTKYLGPTNHRGTRIKATHTGESESVTVAYDYSLSNEENHKVAAFNLANKLDWKFAEYIGGHTKNGMVWVESQPLYSFKIM
tara:strand:- start:8839 stop:9096 length:258 start_codon:yes stop_codon:yes gene_type:complete